MSTDRASLAAWGDYDRDDPFPLFARGSGTRAGPPVTLADGHDGVARRRTTPKPGRAQRPAHLEGHARRARASGDVVAEGLPGPAFARHMLAVDPPDHTRLRRLVAAAFSVRRIEALAGRGSRRSSTSCSTPSRPRCPTHRRRPRRSVRVPAALHRHLRAARRPRRPGAPRSGSALASCSRRAHRRGATRAPRPIRRGRGVPRRPRRRKRRRPDDALVSALISARDGDDRLDRAGAHVDDLPADRRRPRHDLER